MNKQEVFILREREVPLFWLDRLVNLKMHDKLTIDQQSTDHIYAEDYKKKNLR